LPNRVSVKISWILVCLGIAVLALSLMAYARLAAQFTVPSHVTQVAPEPPETLPDFSPGESSIVPTDALPTATRPPSPTAFRSEKIPRPTVTEYSSKPAESPPTRIVASSIGLDSPIVPVGWRVEDTPEGGRTVWEVANDAAGWHINSAYPGTGDNVVISGHNNVAGEVFRNLIDLKEGDIVQLYANERLYAYEVVGSILLEEKGRTLEERRENAEWIAPTDFERLTLVSCWPYTTYTHRLIVIATPTR